MHAQTSRVESLSMGGPMSNRLQHHRRARAHADFGRRISTRREAALKQACRMQQFEEPVVLARMLLVRAAPSRRRDPMTAAVFISPRMLPRAGV